MRDGGNMNKIKKFLMIFRFLFVLPGINWKDYKFRMDLLRWKDIYSLKESDLKSLAYILWHKPEFRNLLLYRNRFRRVFCFWVTIVYRPMNTLYIETPEIGGGLFIQHGFATMIAAKSIGENCWINQQVTIGYKDHGNPPVIGNNVMITCGAKVLGDIIVEDNAVIGANAVVIYNVEKNVVVGGVPAHKLK